MPKGKPVTKRTSKTVTKTRVNSGDFKDIAEMSTGIRTVLKSMISQDGRYSTREGGTIAALYGQELKRMKLQLDVHKAGSTSTIDNVLRLK
tara:strand:+ start:459 stop:731 length:273 start_codon:yes stop_codon:yes gene_type:complete